MAAQVSYGALPTSENEDVNTLKSASFDEEGVEVKTKPSGGRRTFLAVVALALVGTALLVSSSYSPTATVQKSTVIEGTAFDTKVSDLHKSSKKDDKSDSHNKSKKDKKSSKKNVDTINFEETFNPTPVKLHPTQRPNHERKLKKIKPEDGGEDLFDTGKETYNPTPENLHPTSKPKRSLKKSSKVDGKDFVETFNPTPDNLKRQLKKSSKVDGKDFVETFNPTPDNLKRQLKKSSKVDGKDFVETFNPTPDNLKRRGLKIIPDESFVSGSEAQQVRKLKKPVDGGKDLFDKGKETYNPTPENLYKADKKSKKNN
jgi:hypothetical protein